MIEVIAEKTFKFDDIYKLYPIQNKPDTDSGVVQVIAIYDISTLDCTCREVADVWVSIIGTMYDEISQPSLEDCAKGILEDPWVKYKYTKITSPNPTVQLNQVYYLPLHAFTDRTTVY